MDDLPIENQEDEEVMSFLENPHDVNNFLQTLLAKYKASLETYKRYA